MIKKIFLLMFMSSMLFAQSEEDKEKYGAFLDEESIDTMSIQMVEPQGPSSLYEEELKALDFQLNENYDIVNNVNNERELFYEVNLFLTLVIEFDLIKNYNYIINNEYKINFTEKWILLYKNSKETKTLLETKLSHVKINERRE